MESSTYCVFKLKGPEEPTLWKIFNTKEKAIQWIYEHQFIGDFIWEEWPIY